MATPALPVFQVRKGVPRKGSRVIQPVRGQAGISASASSTLEAMRAP